MTCTNCGYTCATCVIPASDQCATCSPTAFRTYTGGKCPCNTGYYDIANTQICGVCHYTCLTCQSGGGPGNCTNCDALKKRVFDNLSGTCKCMANYYDDGTAQCAPCSIKCETCYGATSGNCSTCKPGSHRTFNGVNSCPCDVMYYDDGSSDC